MNLLSSNDAAAWLERQGWLSFALDGCLKVQVRNGDGLVRYRVEISADSATVGVNMAAFFLRDVGPSSFNGAVLWVTSIFPPDEDKFRFVRNVLRGCGVEMAMPEVAQPWLIQFGSDEFEYCFTLLSMALMWSWDACLVIDGQRVLIEVDNDELPSLVTDRASEITKATMHTFKATNFEWPFVSRFISI